jgi:hypothetical protein
MKKLCVLYIYHEQWRESERFQKISENKKIPPRDSLTEKKTRSFLGKTASKKQKYQVTKRKS